MPYTFSGSGIPLDARVNDFGLQKIAAKVVDNVLNGVTYFSRLISQGQNFEGKTMDFAVDVLADTQGQWFTGLETLNSSAVNTTVTLSYAQNAYTQPKVGIMLESMANSGTLGIIPLDTFKYQKAAAQTLQALGSAIYGDGTGNQILGLSVIVGDSGSIGGQSRATYPTLSATVTASSGTLTLAKMATLNDAVSAAGLVNETPNVGLTSKTVWSFYEQLLQPNVRASYDEVGYNQLPLRGKYMSRSSAELRNGAGFLALSYRNMPIIKDDQATPTTTLFFLNEDYYFWAGRSIVPDDYKDVLTKVDLGTSSKSAYAGTGAAILDMPSEFNGFFYQKPMLIPNQAGSIARFYVVGQTVANGFRRSGKLTGITGV